MYSGTPLHCCTRQFPEKCTNKNVHVIVFAVWKENLKYLSFIFPPVSACLFSFDKFNLYAPTEITADC